MEASHKADLSQWTTIDIDNFEIRANGGKTFKSREAIEVGNYNILLDGISPELYDSTKHSYESSHDLFRGAFTEGFPWELISIFSGPPKVAFSFRHWGLFNGEYEGNQGNGEIVNMYGFCVVGVTDKLKVQSIQVYYKPEEFIEALQGKKSVEKLNKAEGFIGGSCPFMKAMKNDSPLNKLEK